MRNVLFAAVWLGILAMTTTGAAQSLADVAKAEAARRKALGKSSAKVYTNDDLRGGDHSPSTVPDAAAAATPDATTAKPEAPANGAAKPAVAADKEKPAQPAPATADPPKDEKYWRNRITEARTALQRSQAFVDALQSHINGLYAEFTAMGDPVQRAGIEKKRNEAIAEQDRVKADITRQTKEIAAIEEEARRASVPAGWLR
jgi:hypothetical protein